MSVAIHELTREEIMNKISKVKTCLGCDRAPAELNHWMCFNCIKEHTTEQAEALFYRFL